MKKPVQVRLEVIHDKDTGLTVNQFSWFKAGKIEMQIEIANRPAFYRGINQYGSPSFQVMAYDEKIDLPLAESRRSVIETMVNERHDLEQFAAKQRHEAQSQPEEK